jgi:anti-anti-sigma factor
MDSAGLQLLILLKREVQEQDKRLTIVGHSAAVQQILDFCNLASTFGDPMVITACP